MVENFKKGVIDFQKWANKRQGFFGEWETDYPDWGTLYRLSTELIELMPVEQWNQELIHDFLYLLARDNECENILIELIGHPLTLLTLAKYSKHYSDFDARWQIAHGLGEIDYEPSLLLPLLQEFLTDECEYVRRRATFAKQKIENRHGSS